MSRSSRTLVLSEGELQQWGQVFWECVCKIPQRLALNPNQGWDKLSNPVTEHLYLVWVMKTNQFYWCVRTPPVSLFCIVNLHHDVLTAVNCACLTKVQYKATNRQINTWTMMCIKKKKIKYEFQITLWQYKSIQQKPSVLLWELGLSRQIVSPAEQPLFFF